MICELSPPELGLELVVRGAAERWSQEAVAEDIPSSIYSQTFVNHVLICFYVQHPLPILALLWELLGIEPMYEERDL
jgi:hypothetical protein